MISERTVSKSSSIVSKIFSTLFDICAISDEELEKFVKISE